MAMTRPRKEAEVEEIKKRLDESEIVVVAHYSGLSVAEMTDYRTQLRAEGAAFKVTKNSLTRRALKGTRYEALEDMFSGPTGIAVSNDPVAAAKVTHKFAKDHKKLVILGGALGERVLDVDSVEALAKLPSLDEVRGKLVGLLAAPATQLARVLQAPAQAMVGVTKAYGEKEGA